MQAPHIAEPFFVQPRDPPSKKAVLRAALTLFVERGIAAVTVRDIAAAAEFSNPVIFKYFPTRDALALQLFESCFRDFSQRLERATAAHLPIARRLDGLIDTHLDALATPDVFLYLHENWRQLWPHVNDELRAFSLPRRVRKLLHDAQQARVVGVAPDLGAALVQGIFCELARRAHAGDTLSRRGEISAAVMRVLTI